MSNIKEAVMLRKVIPSDISFIFSSWLKSYRSSNFAKNISNTIYYKAHHNLIETLLRYSDVIIACSSTDQDQIFGYMVASRIDGIFTIHYAYVKHPYRKLGIGTMMLGAFDHDFSTVGCYTHDTYIAHRLSVKYNLVYHPYLMVINETESKPINGFTSTKVSDEESDEKSEVSTFLIDGQVRNAVYELLRALPKLYECKDCTTKEVLDTIFDRAYLDAMASSAYVSKTEELYNMLYVLERLVTDGSTYTWR